MFVTPSKIISIYLKALTRRTVGKWSGHSSQKINDLMHKKHYVYICLTLCLRKVLGYCYSENWLEQRAWKPTKGLRDQSYLNKHPETGQDVRVQFPKQSLDSELHALKAQVALKVSS